DPSSLSALSDEEFTAIAQQLLQRQALDRQQNALRYYQPVSEKARQIHTCIKKTIGVGGGNGSSKTESCLVEMVIRATGQVPLSLQHDYPMHKLRGPIACRLVCESLTTTLAPIILPKLQWWRWSGVDNAGGEKGHWGWIPKHCLIKEDWSKSWSEKTRMLRLLYRDPANPDRVVGESTIQFMSYDQDPSDFASGDFHFILHDEPPKLAIWQENRARVMRVDGTLMVAMTWPDDPSISVDWIFDELYEKAQPGVDQDPHIAWFDLYTTDNPNLRQDAVAERASQMGEGERAARIFGQPIRLSNRVHPLFTDTQHWWCFQCKKPIIRTDAYKCNSCGGDDIESYCHVGDEKVEPNHPVIFGLDPHPRKPHAMAWLQVDPNDDLHVVMELEAALAPQELAEYVLELEKERGWKTIRRLIDPNMGRSPSGTDRETTWQDAFDKAGLVCDLADDSDVGRAQLNVYLRPDPDTRRPRIHWDRSCGKAIYQMKRFLWDDHKKGLEKDQKQITKKKNDDFPQSIATS
ncbi:MAG: hypothetical protein IPJ44_20840, partial [Nitrospira sp.]|nr:hypothetical protein [Nitrospira sp.]